MVCEVCMAKKIRQQQETEVRVFTSRSSISQAAIVRI